MAVNYNVVARKNPLKQEEAPKFFASLNSKGRRNLRYLAHRIADKSSLNEIDVKAVLEGLIQVIPEILVDGYTVDLEEFGNFHLTCSSEPSETADEVTQTRIKKVSIQFRPGKMVKDSINTIKFTREIVE